MGIEDKMLADLDNRERQKEELIERFIQKSKELTESNKEDNKTTQKKAFKSNKKKVKSANNDNKKSDKIIREQKNQIDKLKKCNYDINKELMDTKKLLKEYESKFTEAQNNLNMLNIEYSKTLSTLSELRSEFVRKIRAKDSKILNQRQIIKCIQTKIPKLKTRVKLLLEQVEALKVDSRGIPNECANEIRKLQKEIYSLKYSKDKQEQESKVKISRLQKIILEQHSISTQEHENIHDYGFITEAEDGSLCFKNTQGEVYSIPNISKDKAVRVIKIDNENVLVDKILDISPIIRPKLKLKSRKVRVITDTGLKFKPYNVLIIGSSNKDKHIQTLTKTGLKVEWFDSFKHKSTRLKEIIDRFDIVICCEEHSKHYATELILEMREKEQSNSIKYNLINSEAERNLPALVNYIIENSNILD